MSYSANPESPIMETAIKESPIIKSGISNIGNSYMIVRRFRICIFASLYQIPL
jgi:hypothetical protein